MTEKNHGTPAHDPARLCAAASNMDIALGIARRQSANGRTVLIWAEARPSGQLALLVPRYQEGDAEPPEDLHHVLGGFTDGVELSEPQIHDWNRRLRWTDRKKQRDRYKPASGTSSASKQPDAP